MFTYSHAWAHRMIMCVFSPPWGLCVSDMHDLCLRPPPPFSWLSMVTPSSDNDTLLPFFPPLFPSMVHISTHAESDLNWCAKILFIQGGLCLCVCAGGWISHPPTFPYPPTMAPPPSPSLFVEQYLDKAPWKAKTKHGTQMSLPYITLQFLLFLFHLLHFIVSTLLLRFAMFLLTSYSHNGCCCCWL